MSTSDPRCLGVGTALATGTPILFVEPVDQQLHNSRIKWVLLCREMRPHINQLFGFWNFELATGTFISTSSKLRVVVGLLESAAETRTVNGNLIPWISR